MIEFRTITKQDSFIIIFCLIQKGIYIKLIKYIEDIENVTYSISLNPLNANT
jgi:hypothetical protein